MMHSERGRILVQKAPQRKKKEPVITGNFANFRCTALRVKVCADVASHALIVRPGDFDVLEPSFF